MNTDDTILTAFLADNQPLDAVAAKLGMTVVALVRWLDRNAELLAAATRAMETRLKFLALRAESVALDDLSSVSRATRDQERKRKSASQLLRHIAKRFLSPPAPSRASAPTPQSPPAAASVPPPQHPTPTAPPAPSAIASNHTSHAISPLNPAPANLPMAIAASCPLPFAHE